MPVLAYVTQSAKMPKFTKSNKYFLHSNAEKKQELETRTRIGHDSPSKVVNALMEEAHCQSDSTNAPSGQGIALIWSSSKAYSIDVSSGIWKVLEVRLAPNLNVQAIPIYLRVSSDLYHFVKVITQ